MFNATKVSNARVIEARILIGGRPRNYTKSEGVHLVANQRSFSSDTCTLSLIVTKSFYEPTSKHCISTKYLREYHDGDDLDTMYEYMEAGNDL